MMYLNDAAAYQECLCAPEGLTCGGMDIESLKASASSDSVLHAPRLDCEEVLAAYVARERHVSPMLRLLLEMSEDQRRLSLAMLQCVCAGNFASMPNEG